MEIKDKRETKLRRRKKLGKKKGGGFSTRPHVSFVPYLISLINISLT